MKRAVDSFSDPLVPGLSVALRADALFELLAARLPECQAGLRFLKGRAVDVQYTPGAGAQVLWKVHVHDHETGRTGRQLMVVRALRSDEAMPAEPVDLVAKYAEMRAGRGMAREMPLRTPWLAVAGAHLLVHAFPLDPALPTLLTIASPGAMRLALHQVWRARGARVRRVRVDTLSYTPGARAAMQYEVLAEDRKTMAPELRRLVGKLDVRRSPARLFASHWAIWRKTFGRVSIAPPVGYMAVARLSLQEFLIGTRLSELAGKGAFVGGVRGAARAIAKVHALELPVLKHRSVQKEMSSVDRWAGVLSGVRPGQAGRLQKISDRFRQELSDRMRITATIHADFHLANILADKHGVTLIDWDQASHGDPMLDVGRFLASLRVASLRLNGTLDSLAPAENAFLEAYLEQSGEDEQRARLFEAASLLTAAAAPFRLQREGWERHADMMIDEVERVLALSLRGPRFFGTHVDLKRQIAFGQRAEWATDRVYAQALLVPIVQEAYGSDIEVTECNPLVKESSRSRLRIRWFLKGYIGSERWKRTVEGTGFPGTSGKSILRRLQLAHAAGNHDVRALRIARPLGLITPLSLMVFEPAAGTRLGSILETARDSVALDELAVGLTRFQSLDLGLSRERETVRIARAVSRRVKAFEMTNHPQAAAAANLLGAAKALLALRGERRTPAIFPLSVRQLWVTADGIAASPVDDVVLADPLVNAGSLLAELTVTALARGAVQSQATRFRCAYLEASGEPEPDLAAWEALMLVRWACARGAREPASPLIPLILHTARQLLEKLHEPQL